MATVKHTQGEARVGNGEQDADCVVMVGKRQILECYEDGEVQTEEDLANAHRVVKTWNGYPVLVNGTARDMEFLRAVANDLLASGMDATAKELVGLVRTMSERLRGLGEAT